MRFGHQHIETMDSRLGITVLWFLLVFICVSYSQVQEEVKVSCTCRPHHECSNDSAPVTTGNTTESGITPDEGHCDPHLYKCCFPAEVTPPRPTPKTPMFVCGARKPDGVGMRVTGVQDFEANYGEFPWMVAVLSADNTTSNSMVCGGSIFHPQVILTAAHCVMGKRDLSILAGEWDTQNEEDYPTQSRMVKEVIAHENFYKGGLLNDIALLVLDKPLELNAVVDTLCLPEQDENMDGRDCVVSGWGKDSYGNQSKDQVILKKLKQPVVRREQCQEALEKTRLGPRFRLHNSFICAGSLEGHQPCKGDGGSPLACPSKDDKNVYEQAGIVAWGMRRGNAGIPNVYVNVPHFRRWIDEKIALSNLA